ncbi:MAG: NAD-dependent epimerase/dehydratase family protein [bacterium]|nr:NAD-dependent epimerase/dehydratase family protein [bacterium]
MATTVTDGKDVHHTGRILVTGGSGFLGRRIVAEAKRRGYEVVAPSSVEMNMEHRGETELWLSNYYGKPSGIIHSAAYYGGLGLCRSDPAGLAIRNIRMAVNLFAGAQSAGVKKIVSVGSACGYPGTLTGVMRENEFFTGRCHPSVEAYGFTKRVQLVLGTALAAETDVGFTQVALTNLYGEHDVFTEARSHVVAALIKKMADAKLGITGPPVLWGTGSPRREFAYVQDAAVAIVDALQWPTDPEPVNLDGEERRIKTLAAMIAQRVGYSGPIVWDETKPDGVARKRLDGAKLKRLPPMRDRTTLADGLSKTIEWYMANKEEADARP